MIKNKEDFKENFSKIIGKRIKEIRKRLQISSGEEFAARVMCDNYKKRSTLQTYASNWENGKVIPDIWILINIAHIGGVSLDWLLSVSDDKTPQIPQSHKIIHSVYLEKE